MCEPETNTILSFFSEFDELRYRAHSWTITSKVLINFFTMAAAGVCVT
jgi:hypothetical protein